MKIDLNQYKSDLEILNQNYLEKIIKKYEDHIKFFKEFDKKNKEEI